MLLTPLLDFLLDTQTTEDQITSDALCAIKDDDNLCDDVNIERRTCEDHEAYDLTWKPPYEVDTWK